MAPAGTTCRLGWYYSMQDSALDKTTDVFFSLNVPFSAMKVWTEILVQFEGDFSCPAAKVSPVFGNKSISFV